ncbi:MAG TPA: alpha/beta fold hydrolase [Gammaproteobacteria bacterium]|jgi:pimeloyl-ACP methyl ester carboxylesterase|nr:alpha/beta fold hydrolase [Gammaproteobacteria bacterium]
MATFILIHGAWHGGWCWERVVPLLEKQGHCVLAPDLPGMGDDHTPLDKITLDVWARFVADLVLQQDEKVILVGHSRGGIVISQAAEYCAEKIENLVYLTAYLLPNKQTILKTLEQHPPRESDRLPKFIMSDDMRASVVESADVRDFFYNCTDAEWCDRAAARLCWEPVMSFSTPVKISEEKFGKIPRSYIECLQDKGIPISMQREMQSALPCERVITLDTDHSPFYSAPEQLAAGLIELAQSKKIVKRIS